MSQQAIQNRVSYTRPATPGPNDNDRTSPVAATSPVPPAVAAASVGACGCCGRSCCSGGGCAAVHCCQGEGSVRQGPPGIGCTLCMGALVPVALCVQRKTR